MAYYREVMRCHVYNRHMSKRFSARPAKEHAPSENDMTIRKPAARKLPAMHDVKLVAVPRFELGT